MPITKRKNVNTPVCHDTDSNFQSPLSDGSRAGVPSLSSKPCNSITFDQFSDLLDHKLRIMRSDLRDDINLAINNLKLEFTETTDHLAAVQSDFTTDLECANMKISKLEEEKSNLETQIYKLNNRLCILEKNSRNCNIEIQSVPERKNENLVNILFTLLKEINISLSDGDIRSIKRIAKFNKTSDRPRSILVTLPSERVRDNIISAYSRYNKNNNKNHLNSSHLGINGDSLNVYVTEHLSPEIKEIHAASRLKIKELGYKYCWVKYGRVFIRKDDTSPPLHVKSIGHVDKFK